MTAAAIRGGRRGRWVAAILGGAACLAAGCGGSMPGADVAARIDGEDLRYQDFELYLRQNSAEQGAALGSAVLSRLFDRFLEEETVRRLAIDEGWIPAGSSRRRALESVMARARARHLPESAVEEYYREHRSEFERPERVRLRQVLLASREAAERARQAWASGVAFEDLVERFAEDDGAYLTGEQDLARSDLPPIFADTIFALAPGEVSPVIAADYGFHLFQVVDRRPAERVPLVEAEVEIRELLRGGMADEELQRAAEEARQRYNVTVFARNIPFDYDGVY